MKKTTTTTSLGVAILVVLALAASWASDLVLDISDAGRARQEAVEAKRQQLDESQAVWEALVDDKGETYRYEVVQQSWTGARSSTRIHIVNGDAVARTFRSQDMSGRLLADWEERLDETGLVHNEGAEPLTLEDLYQRCRDDVLSKDASQYRLYLSLDAAGLLNSCTYAPRMCVDDCDQGVKIRNIELGMPKKA